MLFPYLRWSEYGTISYGINGIIGTKSELFHILIFFVGVWSFLYQALVKRVGKCWDRKGLLGDENMLVLSNVLGLHQDIGHHNALPFCRHYGILGSWAQGKKLVVAVSHIAGNDLTGMTSPIC